MDKMSLFKNNFINMPIMSRLIDNVKNNTMNFGVASVLLNGTKQISRICNNTERTICHGMKCSSAHAEVNTIISYFGKNIYYSAKKGWQLKSYIKEPKKIKYYYS